MSSDGSNSDEEDGEDVENDGGRRLATPLKEHTRQASLVQRELVAKGERGVAWSWVGVRVRQKQPARKQQTFRRRRLADVSAAKIQHILQNVLATPAKKSVVGSHWEYKTPDGKKANSIPTVSPTTPRGHAGDLRRPPLCVRWEEIARTALRWSPVFLHHAPHRTFKIGHSK